jgi:transposase
MAYRIQHIDKKTGAIYVYSVESYWDKEKKSPRNRQVCLGRLDKKTGEIIPSGRKKRTAARITEAADRDAGVTASSKVFGPFALIDKVAGDIGLKAIAKKCFCDDTDDVLSLVYFIVHRGIALSRIEGWSECSAHPGSGPISSQRVSSLLKGLTEEVRERFFSLWLKKLSETECFCYDITSVSSYSVNNEYVRWGYNRDGELLPQINLAMLFGQRSRLPAYFRSLPGFVSDVATLRTTMKSLNFLGIKRLTLILDRGFYSEANLDALFSARDRFILAPPTGRKWVRQIIDAHCDDIKMPDCYRKDDSGESLFMTTHLHSWKGHRCYLHIYYNAKRAAEAYDDFMTKLLGWKEDLEAGKIDERDKEPYAKFFHVKETPKRGRKVTYNQQAIEEHRNRYAGFFCVLTTEKMESDVALEIYRNKDVVENCFDDLKNGLDMKRLRVHSSQTMVARLFVQFLALIVLSRIRTIIKSDSRLRSMTVREVLEAMEPIMRIRYSGRYGELFTETGPLQRDIMTVFGVNLDAGA